MLTFALEQEESPEKLAGLFQKQNKETINPSVGCLAKWSVIQENVGNFLDEMKKNNELMNGSFCNNSFFKLLDHASLYYHTLNQTDRANFYKHLINLDGGV